jgi:hypothetical protein
LAIVAAPQVAVLPAIVVAASCNALLVSQQRCLPVLQQQAVTRCRPHRSNELQSVADSPQQQAATFCRPHCSIVFQRRHLPLLSSVRSTSVGLPSDSRRTFVWLPSYFHPTLVGRSFDFRRTSVGPSSDFRRTWNRCEYFCFVESNFFMMKHLHFLFNPPLPHFTCTLKLACILL